MGHSKIINLPTPVIRKQIGQMAKLFGLWKNSKLRDATSRKANPELNIREGAPEFLSQTRGVRVKHVTRRQVVLNRHFTEIISDVLSLEYGPDLKNLGITISGVETKAWNKGVRIFYTRPGGYDEATHRELIKIEAPLRYTISQRRLVGRAPQVNFVHDATLDLDSTLNKTFSEIALNDDSPTKAKDLVETTKSDLYVTKDLGSLQDELVSKRFSAPPDMNNNLLGLNYPELYDEVSAKLVRGRGEAGRMASSMTFLTAPKPLFRESSQTNSSVEDDPIKRLNSMRKFIINQKLKTQHKARARRKEELLDQNKYKWVVDESNDDSGAEKIAPDLSDPPE